MGLVSLGVENFKSWKLIERMDFAPLTAVFGANSSGKTGLIQMLLLMKQTVESSDRAQVLNFGDSRSLVNLGSYKDIVYRHDTDLKLVFRFKWRSESPVDSPATGDSDDNIEFEVRISEQHGPRVEQFEYKVAGSAYGMRLSGKAKYELLNETGLTRRPGRPLKSLPAPVKCYGLPDQVKAAYQNADFLSDYALAFEELFTNMYYLGPLREFPQRQYTWGGGAPSDVGRKGEKAVDALLASRNRGKRNQRGKRKPYITVEQHVAAWLQELGLVHGFKVEAIDAGANLYRVTIRQNRDSAPALITDVGFGISQVLPVLVLLAYVPEGSLVLLEQPEIHLHPGVQGALADVLIEAATVRKVQVIVESHSEHLLLRLQRRIAETTLSPEDVSLYFAAMRGASSDLTELDVDIFGDVRNWPADFFGDAFGEAAARTKASLDRRLTAQG